ncbi:MAG: hypothetical protein LH475_08390 [Cryobacterium sp.]|uniref:hypothetical protein n=1 Tax=unclassified Cryobacterium TaxID=2649013 RepID=UPI0018CA6495|nr:MULTISPECIES: hypothetical protein [unclassified Cryobacterium]MCY7404628.1 hypothetical protein [Cryobacterium sp.]MEC5153830.1 hypothetical protein [Cryobacterium sp. CAN_C3]
MVARTPVIHRQLHARLSAVGAVLALSLSGCSAFFPNEVTPTGAVASPEPAACSTADAHLVWQRMQEAQPAALGHREITVSADGSETKVDTELLYTSSLTSDELRSRDYFAPDWINFLLSEFEDTGQTDMTDLGHPHVDFDAAKPSVPLVGTTIVGFQTDQIQVAFDVSCNGSEMGSGLLTTSGNGLNATMLLCGALSEHDQPTPEPTTDAPNVGGFSFPDEGYQRQLSSYCPDHG